MNETRQFAKVHEYLNQVRKAEDRIRKLEMRKENLQMLATDIANHICGARTAGNGDKDRTGRIMAEIDEIEERITAAKEEAEQKRERIGAAIRLISDPVSQRCLILHYLENRRWKEVATIIRYSPIQTYRYRISGYTELENFLKHAPDGIKS